MRKILATLLILSLPSLLPAAGVREFSVPSADDGIVTVKFSESTRLPIGASDERAEVTGVNFSVEPRPNDETKLHSSWKFSVKFKGAAQPTAIKVINETEKPSVVEIDSKNLALREGTWVGILEKKPVSRQFFESITAKEPWYRLYKFVITYANGTQSVFHQAVIYEQATRVSMLKTAMDYLIASKPAVQQGTLASRRAPVIKP